MRRARPDRASSFLAWRPHTARHAGRGWPHVLRRGGTHAMRSAWTWHTASAPADEPRMPDEAVVALLQALRQRRSPPVHATSGHTTTGYTGDGRAPLVLLLVVASALLGALLRARDGGSATSAARGACVLAMPLPPGDPPHAASLPPPSTARRALAPGAPAAGAAPHAAVAPHAARAPARDLPDVAAAPR